MLQFVTKSTDRYSVAEVAKMAMEGGCRWVQLSGASLGEDDGALRDVATALVPVCEQNESFLVIDDDVDLVDELKVHGVFLNDNERTSVAAAREKLGAHAILGVRVECLEEILALKGLDVDYVSVELKDVEADNVSQLVERYSAIVKGVEARGVDIHIVARGDYSAVALAELVKAGCAGVAVSSDIADADNPTSMTTELIETLDKARDERDSQRV